MTNALVLTCALLVAVDQAEAALATSAVALVVFMGAVFVYTTMMLWNDWNKCLTGEGAED